VGGGAPFYGVFETSDGRYITIASAEPQFYAELLRLLELDPASLPDRGDRANWPALHARFAAIFKTRTRAHWDALLQQSEVCYAPVLSMEEALAHPHNRARNTFVEVDGIPQPAPAPRFSRTPASLPAAGVAPGLDLAAAMQGWGFSRDELQVLAEAGTLR
jgi:alpha-methylacyl-CoA racemase